MKGKAHDSIDGECEGFCHGFVIGGFETSVSTAVATMATRRSHHCRTTHRKFVVPYAARAAVAATTVVGGGRTAVLVGSNDAHGERRVISLKEG